MYRTELNRRELADMTESSRDSVKYLGNGYRDLVEIRHRIDRDEYEVVDIGDCLIGARSA